jgi:hypothetical protein
MKKILTVAVAVFAALTLIVGITALAATNYGTQGDPLVTLSYLNDVLRPELDSEFDSMLGEKSDELKEEFDAAVKELEDKYANSSAGGSMSTYSVVTIENGQKLTGAVGTEIMLRVGSAKVSAPASPGLIDTTTGGTLDNGGQLVKNHLYMVTIDGRAIVSTGHTLVVVRGPYSIS